MPQRRGQSQTMRPPVTPNDRMAQNDKTVPPYPGSNDAGYTSGRTRFGHALPPIQSAVSGDLEAYNARPLPPIQLPPMRSSPPHQLPPATRDATHTMSVTSLLSRNPESPRMSHRTTSPADPVSLQSYSYAQTQQSYRVSPKFYGSSPNDVHGTMPSRPPAQPHRLDQPQKSFHAPSAGGQFRPMHPRHPSASSEPDVARHSPGTSHPHSPSYHTLSSEPSPTSGDAPAYPAPPLPQISQPPPLNYILTIRQQPAAARACGFGERDRRVIDPPPILELKTTSKATGAPEMDHGGMLALHCTLLNQDGDEDDTEVAQSHADAGASRRLMGSLVAAPYPAKDENGIAGTFFVFPDLSCRNPGVYRLKFTLIRIDPMNMIQGTKHPTVSHVVTDLFSVYTAKDFPGMRASSSLLKALRKQGLNVGVKKGSDARKGKGKAKKGSSSDEDEDSDGQEQEERKQSYASGATDESAENVSPKSKKGAKGKRRRLDGQS